MDEYVLRRYDTDVIYILAGRGKGTRGVNHNSHFAGVGQDNNQHGADKGPFSTSDM